MGVLSFIESMIYPPRRVFDTNQSPTATPNNDRTTVLKLMLIHSLKETSLRVAAGRLAPN